jgi:hypothetical protein
MVATLMAAALGAQSPAYASLDKAGLLTRLQTEQSIVHGWVVQVGQLGNLDGKRSAILADLSFGASSVASLYAKTLVDTSAAALNADAARASTLQTQLTLVEAPKVALATQANIALAAFYRLLRAIKLGVNPPTTVTLQGMTGAKANLDQAIALLAQASLSNYPGSRGLLNSARSLIDAAGAALAAVDRLAIHPPTNGTAQARDVLAIRLNAEFTALTSLRAQVLTDPNLNSFERKNLLDQINRDLIALSQVFKCASSGAANNSCVAAFSNVIDPGVLFLIRPKAEIILAGAADRAAIATLTALLPILQSRIATAAIHHNVSNLNALLSDLVAQLAVASADIGPIDSELLPLTATAAQRSHDFQVINTAVAAMTEANHRLTTAQNDANLILAATA